MKKFGSFLSSLILVAFGFNQVFACGPFELMPLFSFTKHADYPLSEYNRGNVGIVPDSFGRMSLFVFYRQLNNLPLTPEEQKQIERAMRLRIGGEHWSNQDKAKNDPAIKPDAGGGQGNQLKYWETTRAKVLSSGDTQVSPDKLSDDYSYYINCLSDAFRNAAQTLETRIAKYGAADPSVVDWLNAQDTVFSNCSNGSATPPEAPGNAPEWLRQDRDYQIAAALFYQNKLPEARARFEKIAADDNSPWNKTARFVIARTFIRQAGEIYDEEPDYEPTPVPSPPPANTVYTSNTMANYGANMGNTTTAANRPERKVIKSIEAKKAEKTELTEKAKTRLRRILADASMNEFHGSALRLLNLVEYRTNPEQRRRELAQILALPTENRNIYNDLIDYIRLLDRVESDASVIGVEADRKEAEAAGKKEDWGYDYELKLRDVPPAERAGDLTDWLFTYQAADGFAHAFEKWQATQKPAWLVAAIAKADSKTPQINEILLAADKIPVSSPAFPTVRYHQVRLLSESGKRAAAKQKIEEAIAAPGFSKYNVSTQNKFYAQRMIFAENLDEFLKYAQRRPAVFIWSDDANEEGTDLNSPAVFDENDISNNKLSPWANRTMFDEDAVAFFNEKMPLSVLRQAALSPQLPEHLKKFLAAAVWTRAVVLKNQALEREFTPLMMKYAPEYNPVFSRYSEATSPSNREAAELLTVLRYPVIQPFVPIGYGRDDSTPDSIDSNRGNWWCVNQKNEEYPVYYDRYDFRHPSAYPNFLTAAQTAAAEREQRQLNASGSSATYLTRRAIEFATRNPNHAQTPEILHLAVRSTRYGCKDVETGKFSQQAFRILHRRYPNSEWTKKTPYWFGK